MRIVNDVKWEVGFEAYEAAAARFVELCEECGKLTPSHPAKPTRRFIRGDDVVRNHVGRHHGKQCLGRQVRGQE